MRLRRVEVHACIVHTAIEHHTQDAESLPCLRTPQAKGNVLCFQFGQLKQS